MQFVPLKKPHSGGLSRGWRVLVLLFAGLLTLGVLQPFTASAAPNLLQVKDTTVVEADSGTTTVHARGNAQRRDATTVRSRPPARGC